MGRRGATLHVREGERTILVRREGSEVHLMFHSADNCEVQSRIDPNLPLVLKSSYTRAAMLGLLWSPAPRLAHVLGLGGGRMPMFLHYHFPECVIESTEIDPAVVDVATAYFGFRTGPSVRVFVADGRAFLEQRRADPYDIIVVDAFCGLGHGPHRLATREFLEACRRQLAPHGVLVLSVLPGDPLHDRKVETAASTFAHVYHYAHDGASVVFGHAGEPVAREELLHRARSLQKTHPFSFSLHSLARRLRPVRPRGAAEDRGDPEAILTDAAVASMRS